MAILCIDFGTSSVRAAVGDSNESIPLVLDENSKIDNASIPSAICLSADKNTIYLGTKAVIESAKISAAGHYEKSPKRFLSEANFPEVHTPMFAGCSLSKETLIAAFVSYAGHKCRLKGKTELGRRQISETRISHPVFAKAHKESTKIFYRRLERLVSEGAGHEISEEISVAALIRWGEKWLKPGARPSSAIRIDVEEPVAAAVKLVKNPRTNQIGRTLVVDIGAGTVDFVTFNTVTPAEESKEQRLIMAPAHEPASFWKAGDEIDRILLGIIKRKLGSTFASKSRRIFNEIRLVKERVFEENSITYDGIRLTLSELEKEPEFIEMMNEIREAIFKKMNTIPPTASGFAIDSKLTFVFSGGGAGITAIRSAAHSAARDANRSMVAAEMPKSSVDKNALRKYAVDANLERLAVAMGGVTEARDWPRESARELRYFGLAGQKFKPKS